MARVDLDAVLADLMNPQSPMTTLPLRLLPEATHSLPDRHSGSQPPGRSEET
jgi:hypothetical protein